MLPSEGRKIRLQGRSFAATMHYTPLSLARSGNNRAARFFSDPLDALVQRARKHECVIHPYVLMTNHVHVLLTPSEEATKEARTTRVFSSGSPGKGSGYADVSRGGTYNTHFVSQAGSKPVSDA